MRGFRFMLRRLGLLLALAVLTFSLDAFTGQSIARAQDLVGNAGRTDLSGNAGNSGGIPRPPRRPKPRNTATTVRPVTRTKIVVTTPTTGSLSVATEPGAAILVEPLKGGAALEAQMEKDERVFVFGDLKPGRYRVAADLDGYTEVEAEVTVFANKPAKVTLTLQPITYTVTITSNVPTGEVRYATVAPGKNDKYDVTSETRVVQIQNGRAVLPNLRRGTYGIDVRTELVGYKQPLLATFPLPGKTTTYNVTLTKQLSTKTFAATWTSLDAWEAPAGWRVATRKLSASGRGVALPRDETYRYYTDFHLFSSVKMLNGVAASYVVRAIDARNYYLIQITGAKADEPYVLRGFVVKDGSMKGFGSTTPIDGFAKTLKENQPFSVTIEATGNKFKVWITDSQTGDVLPLGTLEDAYGNFPMGAPGVAIRENEQNEIERFVVCTSESPDCEKG
jgi:hypothetical protein